MSNVKRRPSAAEALSKTILFTITFPGTVTVLIPYLLMGRSFPPHSPLFFGFAGGTLAFAGLVLYGKCAWDFAIQGRGTPAPIDPPREFISAGLYRSTRNPMYNGILMIVAGEAIFAVSLPLLSYMLLLWLVFHTWILIYEEPHLRKVFGPSYEEYCSRVPRWLPM